MSWPNISLFGPTLTSLIKPILHKNGLLAGHYDIFVSFEVLSTFTMARVEKVFGYVNQVVYSEYHGIVRYMRSIIYFQ